VRLLLFEVVLREVAGGKQKAPYIREAPGQHVGK
jgi:hypothetical protein